MKNVVIFLIITALAIASACSKDKTSERFRLLTSHTWTSDSLLANGVDASGPGEKLEKFKGDATFNKDGTGTFGQYSGTWMFVDDDASLAISSPDLPVPSIAAPILELTSTSLKVTFVWPEQVPLDIRMTFKPK